MDGLNTEEYPDPYPTFINWIHEEVTNPKSKFPTACVLSTIAINGFPNARNVSLKEIRYPFLIITTSLSSHKGKEIAKNAKVALTFWWESSNRQVRIQGVASPINNEDADFYFSERSKSAQVISTISKQSDILKDAGKLRELYLKFMIDYKEKPIPRPNNWKGFKIEPIKMEFLEFRDTRFHNRVVYTQNKGLWSVMQVQP